VTDVEAWVCFITKDMAWDGGLNQAILKEGGDDFDAHVLEHVFQPKEGQVYCLPAFSAPVDRILLAVIPQWRDGLFDEEQLVVRCYRNLIKIASEQNIESFAVPSLGGGQRNFPQRRVVRLTLNALIQDMPDSLDSIKIVCKDSQSFDAYQFRLNTLCE